MRSRSQTKAVLATVGLLVAICVLPIAIAEVGWSSTVTQSWGQMSYFGSESWSFLTYFLFVLKWLSPVQTLAWVDISQPHYFDPTGHQQRDVMIGLIWHFLVYGNLLIYLQHHAIKSFAAHVHRNDGQIINDDDIERLSSMRRKIVSNRVFHRDEEL
jgi:hypothetical protein